MRHTPQRCLCCRCSSYIVIIDRVSPVLLGSLQSWYWWMGEAPEWRRWDDQCKLPPAATNRWIWEGLIMIWSGQCLKFWGLITGERWIEETKMILYMWNSKCFFCIFAVHFMALPPRIIAILATCTPCDVLALQLNVVLISHLPISWHGDK